MAQQRSGMTRCLMPIAGWVAAEPSLQGLTNEVRSDVIWNLYIAAVTQAAEAFPLVTGDLSTWSEVVAGLPITFVEPEAAQPRGFSTIHWKCIALGLLMLAADSWVRSGRTRVYVSVVGASLLGLGSVLWYTGATWFLHSLNTPQHGRPHVAVQPSQMWPIEIDMPPLETLNTQGLGAGADGRNAFDTPPPGAPPLPTLQSNAGVGAQGTESGQTGSAQQSVQTTGLRRVQLLNRAPFQLLAGQQGTVKNTSAGLHTIEVDSGLTIQSVPTEAVSEVVAQTMLPVATGGEHYAPYSLSGPSSKLQAQAARIRDAISKAAALQNSTPGWGALFWQAVKNEKEIYQLEPEMSQRLSTFCKVTDMWVTKPKGLLVQKNSRGPYKRLRQSVVHHMVQEVHSPELQTSERAPTPRTWHGTSSSQQICREQPRSFTATSGLRGAAQ